MVLATLIVAPAAAAGPSPKPKAPPRHSARTAKLEPPAHRSPLGRSIGSPTDGHLIGGARVNESSYLRIVPVYGQEDARWGLEPLVGMIDRAARVLLAIHGDDAEVR